MTFANLPYHHFKGLAVAFVQGQQEAGEHGEYHNQRGGAGGDAPPDQQKKRDAYKKRTAKTDQLPFRQSQYHLGFHTGQILGDSHISQISSPPTIKLRFKARQPAASFSISKPKLLEWESKLPDIAHLGPTRP